MKKVFIGAQPSLSQLYSVVASEQRKEGFEALLLRPAGALTADLQQEEIERLAAADRRIFLNPGGRVSAELEPLIAHCLKERIFFEWLEPELGERYLKKHTARLVALVSKQSAPAVPKEAPKVTRPSSRSAEVLERQQKKARLRAEADRKARKASRKEKARLRRDAQVRVEVIGGEPPARLPTVLREATVLRAGGPRAHLTVMMELVDIGEEPLSSTSIFGEAAPERGVVYRARNGDFIKLEDVDWLHYNASRRPSRGRK